MCSRFQAASLVASPSYPNSITWSDENLIAVASGHLVTILNPAAPSGPRGLIVLSSQKSPFSVGIVKREEMMSDRLLPTYLSHNYRPCVRSLSWSPLGLAPNGGCLLAICTSEGHVKVFRQPFREFTAEWVEIMDLSTLLQQHFIHSNYFEPENFSNKPTRGPCTQSSSENNFPVTTQKKESKHSEKMSMNKHMMASEREGSINVSIADTGTAQCLGRSFLLHLERRVFSSSLLRDKSLVEVFKLEGAERVWIRGIFEHKSDNNAFVTFTNKNGNYVERVESKIDCDELHLAYIPDCDSMAFPKIRPCMNTENLPQEFTKCVGIEEVILSGQSVEVWINDRWVEGSFTGFSEGGLMVKFHGHPGPVFTYPNLVRFAPTWISEERLWHVTVVRLKAETPTLLQMDSGIIEVADVCPLEIAGEDNVGEITSDQYSFRTALLYSLVVSWSPRIRASESGQESADSSKGYSLLAVGGKSGNVSLWRVNYPSWYSVGENIADNCVVFGGLFYTHNSWVTSISWTLIYSDLQNPVSVMATGSSDGSVKLWNTSTQQLLISMEDMCNPFSLLNEVTPVGYAAVSVIAISVSPKLTNQINLAVGRGSGSFDVWIFEFVSKDILKLGSFDAHQHVITGLVWAFEGTCLYSCSQDNSLRGWILHKSSIIEASIPFGSLRVDSSIDVPNVFDSCYGIDVAHGNFAVALVRSCDPSVLNPMYQMRTVKAVVEFFLIGGQGHVWSNDDLDMDRVLLSGFSENNTDAWRQILLHSMNTLLHREGPLIPWDTLAVLLSFKNTAPVFLHSLLSTWLSDPPFPEETLPLSPKPGRNFSGVPSSHLHLLNIICRRVMLAGLDPQEITTKAAFLRSALTPTEKTWLGMLLDSEHELRARLVCSALISAPSLFSAQMEGWVRLNRDRLPHRLVFLTSKLQNLGKREEKCSYCEEGVKFEREEEGVCGGGHRLGRCAVTMKILNPPHITWYCPSCARNASHLPPPLLFSLLSFPSSHFHHSSSLFFSSPPPFCPFCSLLLVRIQPHFLLSPSPV